MEARPWKDGATVTYRYLTISGQWMNLGTDKQAALRNVLDLNGDNSDRGSISELWCIYQESHEWADLSSASQVDYRQCWKQLEKRFATAPASAITPSVMARYLRKERASAPVRANRESALMSNLMNVAVERGDILANPCKQVRRNKERPRPEEPTADTLIALLEWAQKRPGQAQTLAGAAEFAALTGKRQSLHRVRVQSHVIEVGQAGHDREGHRKAVHVRRPARLLRHRAQSAAWRATRLHWNPVTTAKVYDRTKVVKRSAL